MILPLPCMSVIYLINFMQGEVGQHSPQPEMFSLPPVNDFDTFAQLKLG